MKRIAEHLYRLGDADHPCFLVTGADSSVLVDAGPAFMAPAYRQQIRQMLGDGSAPDWLFLTHFHYDHAGGAPYLLRHFPAMKTAGSAKLGRLFAKKRIAASVTEFNRSLMAEHLPENDFLPDDFDYGSLQLDRNLEDGDRIDLGGGVTIEVMAAPGHTSDNLCFYLPHVEAAVAAEAVGIIPGDEFWVAPQFLSSYEDYLGTIERVRRRRPKIVVLGHHRVVRGTDVGRFFEAAQTDCREFRDMVARVLQKEKMSEDKVVHRIFEQLVRAGRRGGQPEAVFHLNLQVQVKIISRQLRMGEKKS
jgi:glyoxylase-like metal-dependent hydrolase (beta-lactamase superfamily II)